MSGFIDTLDLSDVLADISLKTSSDNLEEIYMELDERSITEADCMNAKTELENRIREYMLEFKLPDTPTVYDFANEFNIKRYYRYIQLGPIVGSGADEGLCLYG